MTLRGRPRVDDAKREPVAFESRKRDHPWAFAFPLAVSLPLPLPLALPFTMVALSQYLPIALLHPLILSLLFPLRLPHLIISPPVDSLLT